MVTLRMYRRWVSVGSLLLLFIATSAFTQEKGKDAPKEKDAVREDIRDETNHRPKNPALIRAGYTRPGSPADKLAKNGEIIQAALDLDQPGPMIGSTGYLA